MGAGDIARAVSHPAMLALHGKTVRIEAVTSATGGTCLFLHDPNTDVLLGSVVIEDEGSKAVAWCGLRCGEREQARSYKRKRGAP